MKPNNTRPMTMIGNKTRFITSPLNPLSRMERGLKFTLKIRTLPLLQFGEGGWGDEALQIPIKTMNMPVGTRYLVSLLAMFMLIFIPYSLSAQDTMPPSSPQDTVTALENAVIPINDPFTIANRLYGIEAPPAPTEAPPYRRGERSEFWVSDNSAGQSRQIMAELEVIGLHAYFWVEVGADVRLRDLQALADAFDNDIYQQVRDIWGSEPYLGVDGDPRVHILFARGLGFGTAAYFSRRHNYPEIVSQHSNAREMFFVNLSTIGNINSSFLRSTLAHEFQHMIRANITPNEDSWLNEAFSTFTEGYLGYEAAERYPAEFLNAPETQLTTFGIAPNRLAEYGAGYLFMTYIYNHYGIEAIQALSANPLNSMFGVQDVMMDVAVTSHQELFADWVLANLIQDVNLRELYGYYSLNNLIPPATRRLNGRKNQLDRTLSQYATHYYQLSDWRRGDTLTLSLDMPDTAPLVHTDAHSGERFWYSNRADVSHMRLYRQFDLSDVTSATFTYQLWADLEPDWDYGYLLISTDDGVSWQTIQTETMTTANPVGNRYGDVAYSLSTGRWIKEQVILDEYVGGEIWLSFELITDDAVNYSGIVIDDVALPEIGYYSDFETDDGGWISEGWVWVTNHIPQQAWLQVVQYLPDDVIVHRWFLPTWDITPITIDSRTETIFIAMSPIARVTTIPVEYNLTIRLDD